MFFPIYYSYLITGSIVSLAHCLFEKNIREECSCSLFLFPLHFLQTCYLYLILFIWIIHDWIFGVFNLLCYFQYNTYVILSTIVRHYKIMYAVAFKIRSHICINVENEKAFFLQILIQNNYKSCYNQPKVGEKEGPGTNTTETVQFHLLVKPND